MQGQGDGCFSLPSLPAVGSAVGAVAAGDRAEVPKALAALLSWLTVALVVGVVKALFEAVRCEGLSWQEVCGEGGAALAFTGCFGSSFSSSFTGCFSSSAAATAASTAAFFKGG